MTDRYGTDVLSNDPHRKAKPIAKSVEATHGLVVECATTGFCGSVVRTEKTTEGLAVELEDRHGRLRMFPMISGGFMIDGEITTLVRPSSTAASGDLRAASGARYTGPQRARVARASRIWVEGVQDAELIEKVWGYDLRAEGIVVEPIHGADNLAAALNAFQPGETRKVGVLLDHMVVASKEMRIAEAAASHWGPDVLVTGHPFVDVWQAVKPGVVGIDQWPTVPRGVDWKEGVIEQLGWKLDPPAAWQQILNRVSTYADLQPEMLARVEELIDFVTLT